MSKVRFLAVILPLIAFVALEVIDATVRDILPGNEPWFGRVSVIIGGALVCAALVLMVRSLLFRYEPQGYHTGCMLALRRIGATIIAFFFPQAAGCYRCYMPWTVTERHCIDVPGLFGEKHNMVWALCEHCDREMTPECRLVYYAYMLAHTLVKIPHAMPSNEWRMVSEAVLNEEPPHEELAA